MVARTAVRLLVVAGTLVPATVASGAPAWAQLPSTTTTLLPLPTTTSSTTTTTEPATTTTTADPSGTTTTQDPGGTATTTTSTTTSTSTTSTTLAGGGLSISVPAAAELSAGTPVNAGAVTANLGPVTVTDARTGLVAGWTVSVTGSAFTTGGGSPAETIPAGNVAYWSGPATATTGTAAFAPGQPDAQHAQPLAAPCTAFSALTSSGGTSATWNPGLVVTLPPTVVTGQYHGTITHSVA